ncbi:hypothetical protein THAOC_03083 [Thalassiosira oceanica]|uniref:Uncharacterized protein n=1 Tax=Thalassiosira oceanica TaxID=159749 RepID=K0TCT3_THAOC|nr:hypothetical protein THAOC_03083 [Thalassiosira oceanica]|eukprot:EJK75200.1 hypothetical protein THAOC_03083 [Thalassiosira oceanica]
MSSTSCSVSQLPRPLQPPTHPLSSGVFSYRPPSSAYVSMLQCAYSPNELTDNASNAVAAAAYPPPRIIVYQDLEQL